MQIYFVNYKKKRHFNWKKNMFQYEKYEKKKKRSIIKSCENRIIFL